jgi:hypothetical protein
MELHYAFIKDNRVMQVAVFASQDEELADSVAQQMGYDDAVWLGETVVTMWSTYDGVEFVEPTLDYLYEVGASSENQAMIDARILAEMEAEDPA